MAGGDCEHTEVICVCGRHAPRVPVRADRFNGKNGMPAGGAPCVVRRRGRAQMNDTEPQSDHERAGSGAREAGRTHQSWREIQMVSSRRLV